MKRILLIALVVLIGIPLLAYFAFRIQEYFKGNSYVTYLKQNMESVAIDEAFTFDLLREDVRQNQIILVGEIHGFEAPTQIDVELFSLLRKEHQVSDYFVEMDYSQAYYLNLYNESGDEALLKAVLKNWVVSAGRNNLDYRIKWEKLRALYQEFPFRYIGNNNLSDVKLLAEHLGSITKDASFQYDDQQSDSLNVVRLQESLQQKMSSSLEANLRWELSHLLHNMEYYLDQKYREEVLTENFLALYEYFGLDQRQVYGFYGLGHTLQAPLQEGFEPMISRVVRAKPELSAQVLTLNFLFQDSHMVVPSASLPSFMKDKGEYTRLPVSYDNIWTSYLHGVEDLKRVTCPETKSLIRISGKDSPYAQTQRLFRMSKLLPFGQVLNAAEGRVATDYGQYLFFVRNSDWAEPLASN